MTATPRRETTEASTPTTTETNQTKTTTSTTTVTSTPTATTTIPKTTTSTTPVTTATTASTITMITTVPMTTKASTSALPMATPTEDFQPVGKFPPRIEQHSFILIISVPSPTQAAETKPTTPYETNKTCSPSYSCSTEGMTLLEYLCLGNKMELLCVIPLKESDIGALKHAALKPIQAEDNAYIIDDSH
ncbi:hypothetical protein E5288_WYG019310 [Bos mutus]|uniref:Uncharacterized protein n=1 Tax=Bos mutus TaxID=72004 RepID=A0A6B0RAG9_9CETA|nr:hypothetical protein [Bos mutus]